MALTSKRASEKTDLQILNHRFLAYIQAVRSVHDIESQRKLLYSSSEKEEGSLQSLKLQYERQIGELQAKVEEISKEKHEVELNGSIYASTLLEYESRIATLNQSIFEKQSDLQQLHGALSAKDVEIQEAKSETIQFRLALDSVRLEIVGLKKRLHESERRLQLEIASKGELQQQLLDVQGKMKREIAVYQQELSAVQLKLEKSHELTLQLEEKVKNVNHSDSSLIELMEKVREASAAELKRFMEETKATYILNIQEVEMRMEADAKHLTALTEENVQLKSQLDAQSSEIRAFETKLAVLEEQKKVAMNSSSSERTMFQAAMSKLEIKLKETQHLLLVKIQELGAAQEANIPLRAEINALKILMEEEEKRLNLSHYSSMAIRQHQSTSTDYFTKAVGFDASKQTESSQQHLSYSDHISNALDQTSSLDKHGFTKFSAAGMSSIHSDASAGAANDEKIKGAAHKTQTSLRPIATGNLKIHRVADDGSSITIANSSSTQEESLGGFMLQQNAGSRAAAVFIFPSKATIAAKSSTSVWSAKAVDGIHAPPNDYIWSKLDKWGTGPECTTILSGPNGQAVAWMTSATSATKKSKANYADNMKQQLEETKKLLEALRIKKHKNDTDSIVESAMSEESWKPESMVVPDSYNDKPSLHSNIGHGLKPLPSINKTKHGKSSMSSGEERLSPKTESSPTLLHPSGTTASYRDLRSFTGRDKGLVKLTTQKNARSKYGFDYMAYPPKASMNF